MSKKSVDQVLFWELPTIIPGEPRHPTVVCRVTLDEYRRLNNLRRRSTMGGLSMGGLFQRALVEFLEKYDG